MLASVWVPLAIVLASAGAAEVLDNSLRGSALEDRPASIKDISSKVKFYLFNSDSPDGKQVDLDKQSLLDAGWLPLKGVKIIVHGYGKDITDPLFDSVAGAYLDTGYDGNVVGVDWGALCPQPLYGYARKNVKPVGQRIATFVEYLVNEQLASIGDVHLIGHSLGAHVVGNCGKKLQSSWEIRPKQITGLDPAMPLFLLLTADRLAKSDADLVDVIHTCGGFYGLLQPVGQYDFYPNGGQPVQPGCNLLVNIDVVSCSHQFVHKLYGESIRNTQAFESSRCDSLDAATAGKCDANLGTARMGQVDTYQKPGLYYLKTEGSPPYSLS